MTNIKNTVLYTGATYCLAKRVLEHKQKLVDGFSKKYNVIKLVYFESCPDLESTLIREKQIKGWTRVKKEHLIKSKNSDWHDLYYELSDDL